ncbi:H+-ATPase G subunit-domain-containing protein [Pelagophyceae sp. CCMP2097]|nr:H+-ATPase G subunit-domain-containing protein [Pelagophyceae sp. CCMP2097]|mmetsp:Transcript_5165/g.16312  ORF Transcript_5165/g.16312 Transcript_5165/m.16312 type:complete len:123 (+) Transcript_5165:58-426(+)|eukprot:CAMPEP_0184084006 /NCGR_PEP_ID=MMETSP0974-20121125/3991_1 /TAXON_ID=483370 /ORGANISM="non described non described, Strain CCMP2097" /LENGTH=122 /DNA_ID=CAMNT_0026386683 /DNA_START=60 /DNA_END=428 /DNA_ORIENTATION=-
MSGTAGIQELMSAENRASQIVAEARAARGERMKDAKREAEEVIKKVRAENEATFQQSSMTSANDKEFNDMKRSADNEIATMTRCFEANKDSVTQLIVKVVTDVSLELSETRVLAGQRACGRV